MGAGSLPVDAAMDRVASTQKCRFLKTWFAIRARRALEEEREARIEAEDLASRLRAQLADMRMLEPEPLPATSQAQGSGTEELEAATPGPRPVSVAEVSDNGPA